MEDAPVLLIHFLDFGKVKEHMRFNQIIAIAGSATMSANEIKKKCKNGVIPNRTILFSLYQETYNILTKFILKQVNYRWKWNF